MSIKVLNPNILRAGATIVLRATGELSTSIVSILTVPEQDFKDWYDNNCLQCLRLEPIKSDADLNKSHGCILNEAISSIRCKKEEILLEISEKNITLQNKDLKPCKLKL